MYTPSAQLPCKAGSSPSSLSHQGEGRASQGTQNACPVCGVALLPNLCARESSPQESSLRPRMRPHLPEWTLCLSVHCKILTHSLGESLPRSAATASCMLSISRVQSGCLCPWRAPLSSLPGHHNMLHHQPPRTPQSGQLSQATSRGPLWSLGVRSVQEVRCFQNTRVM